MDYVAAFPLTEHLLPKRLHELLLPIGTDPEQRVEVTCFTENEGLGVSDEAVYMVMAVVPDDGQAVPSLHTE